MRLISTMAALVLACSAVATRAADAPPLLAESPADAGVSLVSARGAADVYVDANDAAAVRHAASLLAQDVERVTGKRPTLRNDAAQLGADAVIVGTIGQSKVIDALIADGKLDVSAVRGKWETFVIATVERPLPNVERAVVIAGSDRRGAAFGAFEVSEQIGVSPWYWWADVAPTHRDTLAIKAGTHVVGPPKVKYRGIFINDEDWGLTPWAAKTFEPGRPAVGPKTYAKIFELLLRLKANYIWPAMHPCTAEFGAIDENITTADEWGIVMGASHAEPMNRNNVYWDSRERGEWRYDTNRDGVIKYWEEWAQKRGKYEAVWTLGMRGIHDRAMNGPTDVRDRARLLGQAILDQRALLGKHVAADVTTVPQAFMPYREVLAQYEAGLKVPDDVTLVWCDDNLGYLRQLSTPQEQQRSGGAGVYYHISYLGAPKTYLWVNTTPPALIWQQMRTALAYGADRIWVLNVGDIKPGEIGMEFWTRMAWNPDRWSGDVQQQYLTEWAAREFGSALAPDVARLMQRFYLLGAQRKPEMMLGGVFANPAEAADRLTQMREMLAEVERLRALVPPENRDAFTELVGYPVRVAALTAEAFLSADLAERAMVQGRPAGPFAQAAGEAVRQVRADTDAFNTSVAGGKWNHMMILGGFDFTGEYRSWDHNYWPIPWPNASHLASGGRAAPVANPRLAVLIDGRATPLVDGQLAPDATVASDVNWSIASDMLPAPWKLVGEGDARGAGIPNGAGDQRDPAKATPLSFDFTLAQPGRYHLFGEVIVPTPDDDSFLLRIDGGEWRVWNGIRTSTTPAWREQGTYDLSAGRHVLEVAPREDGAAIRSVRLTRRPTAEPANSSAGRTPPNLLRLANAPGRDHALVHLFMTDGSPLQSADVTCDQPWLRCEPADAAPTALPGEQLRRMTIDWDKLPSDPELRGSVTFAAAGKRETIEVRVTRVPADGTFGEIDGLVSMEAEHFTRSNPAGEAAWTNVPRLGRTGDGAVTVWPPTVPSIADVTALKGGAPSLEYDFMTRTADADVSLHAYCHPGYRLHAGRGLRYAVAIDDATPQIVDFEDTGGGSGDHGDDWSQRKLRNIAETISTHRLGAAGRHTLRLWMVDPNVVVDKLVLDLGGLEPSELGPPETRSTK